MQHQELLDACDLCS